MWIFTKNGFVSAVRKKEYPDFITVRARDRESLTGLADFAAAEIAKSPDGDYPYRAFVRPDVFANWVAEESLDIDYHNFKTKVSQTRGYQFVAALHDVWTAMLQVEDDDAREGEATKVNPS
jgi:hypothetical protein